jgi:hypothetical protein
MHLKLYLNKYLKVDNIENYSLQCLIELRQEYDKFLDLTGGYDPDFPSINIGNREGQKIKGKNKIQLEKGMSENEFPDEVEERLSLYNSQQENSLPEREIEKSGVEEILNLHK